MDIDNDRIKHRQLCFDGVHPNPDQARTAADLLSGEPGIIKAHAVKPLVLEVTYDLHFTKLEEIESAITELGLHLDAPLSYRIKRALWYYTEDTYRANNNSDHSQIDCTKKVFATRYENLDHSLRDHRPEHWRRYL
jgi:hypothetical protein